MIKVYQATEFANNEKPYKHVANVDTDSINEAFASTQNGEESWSEHGHRSTSEGDVLVHNNIAYFLVPMGNGRHGNKSYENWGDTEVIKNFDINGFIYQGEQRIHGEVESVIATDVEF